MWPMRLAPVAHKLVKRRHDFPFAKLKVWNHPNIVGIHTGIPKKLLGTKWQQPRIATARITASDRSMFQAGETDGTSGPHPRPDPPEDGW